ncbi:MULTISPECIES: hypothetical protein [Nocardiopsis]|uniref:Uncharacterized protein n=1 Tax=Nocardiopsis dassonvillei (strain ATCC 23218 / DSM 43111 / CIP 107115 / JCM 7437 / KCTC 9190 / NBRC 14626 / NCTC 10488 / NRRL B-5397 / IMRU 509) TaxID=446468 RepID=D7AY54_NOCDD|nr:MULTISPECIES: hypothetical protein [Nocardiopsis]ADH69932.1 conserved hypothetical protein [Nocardiopsis dassonvillei subsp. dassonvillei DSM 43111]APC37927.1 hypothetical protein A9R04_26080 [Nocardiopsis dassonvillei]NKY77481.1 hypothetical protein [Nocardiopsis dassonvillei]VEI90445.1 Uncharacterised protein [Nocardiopsis dassonvillei]
MALVRRGSRRITVDGTGYRWRVRRRPTYAQGLCESPMTFAVELAEEPGQTLVVATRHPHPGSWLSVAPPVPVTPGVVSTAIRNALAQGWSPASPGSAHHTKL